MGYTLKLVGFGLTAFAAVTLGTAAGNQWTAHLAHENYIKAQAMDVSVPAPTAKELRQQTDERVCEAKHGLYAPEAATVGPLKGKHCIMLPDEPNQ